MMYPDYLEAEVIKFCEINNIPHAKGLIHSKYIPMIRDFLITKNKHDRFITKRFEEENRLSIKSGIVQVIQKLTNQKSCSPIEEFLQDALIKFDLMRYFVSQFQIGTKTVDFACPLAHLAVECDGMEYHFSDQLKIEKDQKRDLYLARKGWRVLHIEGLAIRRNINMCIDKIKEAIKPFIPNL